MVRRRLPIRRGAAGEMDVESEAGLGEVRLLLLSFREQASGRIHQMRRLIVLFTPLLDMTASPYVVTACRQIYSLA